MTLDFDKFIFSFILENNSIFHRKSWISPTGVITFLQGQEHHATAITRFSNKDYDELMKDGWQTLSIVRIDNGGIVWVRNDKNIRPTKKQIESITNMAIDNDLTEVSIPLPNFKKIILWEK